MGWTRRDVGKQFGHDLSIEKVRVDPVAQVMEKSRQNNAFVLCLGEGNRGVPEELLMILKEVVHLLVAQVGCP